MIARLRGGEVKGFDEYYDEEVSGLHRNGGLKAVRKTGLKTRLKTGLKKGSTGARIPLAFEKDSDLTISELVKMLGLARSSATEQVAKLKSAGLLRRVGPDKGGHWEVMTRASNAEA